MQVDTVCLRILPQVAREQPGMEVEAVGVMRQDRAAIGYGRAKRRIFAATVAVE